MFKGGRSVSFPLTKGEWKGKEAILVGGGPSLQGFDWSLLKDHPRVVVVNRAFKDVPTAAIWFSEDFDVITRLWGTTPEWTEFKGVKVLHALDKKFERLVEEVDPGVHFLRTVREGKFWAKDFSEGLSYSSNSMIGALNLVDIMGADRICLLGVDCQEQGEREVNYHKDYDRRGKPRAGDAQYRSFKSDFENWAAWHLRGREVINLNPTSAVTCWPKEDAVTYLSSSLHASA